MSHMKLHAISSSVPIRVENGTPAADYTRATADRDAVELFNKTMHGKPADSEKNIESHHNRYKEDKESQKIFDEKHSFTVRDPLSQVPAQDPSSLFGMHGSFGGLFAEGVEQTVSTSALGELEIDMLVERILVSRPDSGGTEVRLVLGGDMLKGTEIVIQRDNLGMLSVQLHANEAAAFQKLVASQHKLRDTLEGHENGAVRLTVAYSGDDRHENDAERRSKGLFLYDNIEA